MKNKIVNSGLIALVLITMTLSAWAQGNANSNSNEFVIPLTDPNKRVKLKAHLNSGSISIKGSARKDILVKYKGEDEQKGKSQSKDGLRRVGGGGMELEASENENSVKISSSTGQTEIDLEIEVPMGTDLYADTFNDGELVVNNVQGDLELKNYNGEIMALNISGSVIATTYNGDIKLTFDKVTDGVPMSFVTYNGNVDLTLPGTAKASLKMKTQQGEIYTGFEMNITSSGLVQNKDNKSGTFKVSIDEWKRGDINGGGPEFTMKTNNGDIYVRKK
jgi:Putative adhesin